MSLRERKSHRTWRARIKNIDRPLQLANLFCHIPKTAGTSLRKALEGLDFTDLQTELDDSASHSQPLNLMNIHLSMDWLFRNGVLDPNETENSFSFCFCRNPFGRAQSLYSYLGERGFFPQTWSFYAFLDYLRRAKPRAGGAKIAQLNLAAPQKSFIYSELWGGPTRVFRFEAMDSEIAALGTHLKFPFEIEHLNASSFSGYASNLGPKERQAILDIYQEDFEYFGYDLEPPKWPGTS